MGRLLPTALPIHVRTRPARCGDGAAPWRLGIEGLDPLLFRRIADCDEANA